MLLFHLTQRTQLYIKACYVLYTTVLRTTRVQNACTRLSLQQTRVHSVALLRMLKNMKLGLNFDNCLDQIKEHRVQYYLTLADLEMVHQIVHTEQLKVEVKTCLLWLKIQMVSFYLCFELFIENLFFKWVFSLQFIVYKTNTISFFLVTSLSSFEDVFCSYRMVFCRFTCILHLYLLHLKPSN